MPRNPGVPHYRRVMNMVLARPELIAGGRLPSERELAQWYGVARGTAARALRELAALGHALRIRGSGTFAAGGPGRAIVTYGFRQDSPRFARFYTTLTRKLGEAGLRLVALETGLRGEYLGAPASVVTQLKALQPEAVVWFASSHPEGLQTAARIRRHLPAALPLLLINDPLGLNLQGGRRFDLVHFDVAYSLGRVMERLRRLGGSHPVLVDRQDIHQFLSSEIRSRFIGELAGRGVENPLAHVLTYRRESPASFREFFRATRTWEPSAFILQYPFEEEFRSWCRDAGVTLGEDVPVIPFGGNPAHLPLAIRLPWDYQALGSVCVELLLSRLQNPRRPNLHVGVSVPLRSRQAQLES
jgi:DNA-binding LacI/PurR family transcriptional regulator